MARDFAPPLLAIVNEDEARRTLGIFDDIDDALDAFFNESMANDTPSSRMFIVEMGDPAHRMSQLPAEALPTGCAR